MADHDAEFYISDSESLKERKDHQNIFYIGKTKYYFTISMKIVGLVWLDFLNFTILFRTPTGNC